jgi:hypothetical protein
MKEVLAMVHQLTPDEKERMKEVLSNSPVTREWAREWAGELPNRNRRGAPHQK